MRGISRMKIVLFLLASALASAEVPVSAIRLPGESFEAASARVQGAQKFLRESVKESAFPFDENEIRAQLNEWGPDEEILRAAFATSRDRRFLEDVAHPGELRRPTWLYPDDGCYARAALVVQSIAAQELPKPQKIFVFGELEASSPNAIIGRTPEQDGTVSWWFHVAPIARVGEKIFVFDAALEPRYPLEVEKWVSLMSPDPTGVKVAICDPHAYIPKSACRGVITDGAAESHQKSYFEREWKRLLDLARDPVRELGESPPWRETVLSF